MPFELGLSVAWAKLNPQRHTYLVFESVNRRVQKSLSDLAGTDCNIHNATPAGIMRELCSAFVRQTERPRVPDMMRHYEIVRRAIPNIKHASGAQTLFEARAFDDLVLFATAVSRSDG